MSLSAAINSSSTAQQTTPSQQHFDHESSTESQEAVERDVVTEYFIGHVTVGVHRCQYCRMKQAETAGPTGTFLANAVPLRSTVSRGHTNSSAQLTTANSASSTKMSAGLTILPINNQVESRCRSSEI
jgi:hypothetical protein